MGRLTRLEVIEEGLRTAQRASGDTEVKPLAVGWLNRWLDSVAASWPWPMLRREAPAVPASTPTVSFGNGDGTIPVGSLVLDILDNIWVYDANYSSRARVAIREQENAPPALRDPASYKGTPMSCRILQTAFGKWTLELDPPPDRPYLLHVPYVILPPALTADGDIPWYPNDETLVQAVAFKTHEYADGKDSALTVASQQLLSQFLSNDRIRYGNNFGINSKFGLSDRVFRDARVNS